MNTVGDRSIVGALLAAPLRVREAARADMSPGLKEQQEDDRTDPGGAKIILR